MVVTLHRPGQVHLQGQVAVILHRQDLQVHPGQVDTHHQGQAAHPGHLVEDQVEDRPVVGEDKFGNLIFFYYLCSRKTRI